MSRSSRQYQDFESALAVISTLPDDQKIDALLRVLTSILRETPAAALREKRARFMAHFARCGCSFEVCRAVQDLVDLHLKPAAGLAPATQAAEARRKPQRRGGSRSSR